MINSLDVNAVSHFGIEKNSAMEMRRKAGLLFSKALSRGQWRKLRAKLSAEDVKMRYLGQNDFQNIKGYGRITEVAIEQIVGSEGRSADFDKFFNPLKVHLKDRWTSIAAARRQGVVLPPVELIKSAEGYYVRDGHHRISVAKAFGQATIEAVIV